MNVPVKDSRTALLLGEEGVNTLKNAFVAVFGVGGVGGFACEALARAGVGRLLLVDDDTVSESNLNRQIVALRSTIGRPKVEVMAERIRDIDPTITVDTRQCFFTEENADSFDFSAFSYVIDAIDTVSSKVELICRAKEANTPIVSCMGAGNKLDPTKFVVTDLVKTDTCGSGCGKRASTICRWCIPPSRPSHRWRPLLTAGGASYPEVSVLSPLPQVL